ncbi:phosphate ABC transporter substrate-binding protein PstS [Niveibacterium umoris]|uniref:Phosphate-binding protein PstS n=1 Tax=Niveibacterium umoris TaxID=1193620 RepID=A0A840BG81_9RHOO|nr:phosphate ABC transporter substrate-binding protein PstS [Niveibacterium umoris]MBB4012185.1 phosphate transport system substrate-binding protein [Niveibacterium umoris]
MRHTPAVLLSVLLVTTAAQASDLSGAGSSAAAPLYNAWAAEWGKKTGVKLEYTASGSSAGIKAIKEGKVDFGASDVSLPPDQLERDGLVNFPTAISGVVPAINVNGVARGQLKLTGAVLADILSGRINRWNASAITALNPGVRLPDQAITVIGREDGSGTTYVLSNYLSKVSPQWASSLGNDFKLKWPEGTKLVKGTSAQLEALSKTSGAIAYAEYGQVEKAGLNYARVANSAGNYPAPGPISFKAALKASAWTTAGKFEEMLTDMQDKEAWPITSGTFVVMRKKVTDASKAAQALSLFSYGFMRGDAITAEFRWIAMPDLTQARAVKEMNKVRDKDGQPIAWNMNF